MRSMSKKVGAALLLTAVSSTSFASGSTQMAAGCGVGTLLLKDQEGLVYSLLAATINTFTFSTVTMTLGELGCPSSASIKGKIASFIDFNKPQLAVEIAQGSGEHLDALIEMTGVSDRDAAVVVLKANHADIFAHDTGDAIEGQIEKVLNINLS